MKQTEIKTRYNVKLNERQNTLYSERMTRINDAYRSAYAPYLSDKNRKTKKPAYMSIFILCDGVQKEIKAVSKTNAEYYFRYVSRNHAYKHKLNIGMQYVPHSYWYPIKHVNDENGFRVAFDALIKTAIYGGSTGVIIDRRHSVLEAFMQYVLRNIECDSIKIRGTEGVLYNGDYFLPNEFNPNKPAN